MADVTVVVSVYEEAVGPAVEPNPDSFVGYSTVRQTRIRFDAEWVALDERHHWMLPIGFPLVWLGPYWTNGELERLAGG